MTCKYQPRLSFTISAQGWWTLHDEDDLATFDRWDAAPRDGPPDLYMNASRAADVDTPGELHQAVSAIGGLEVTAPEAATVGGAQGIRFEISGGDTVLWRFPSGKGSLNLFAGRRARIYAVQIGPQVAIIQYQTVASRFEAASAEAEAVIATIQFLPR